MHQPCSSEDQLNPKQSCQFRAVVTGNLGNPTITGNSESDKPGNPYNPGNTGNLITILTLVTLITLLTLVTLVTQVTR